MPYIKSNDGRREALQAGDVAKTAGELNYQLFNYIKYHINNKTSMAASHKLTTCVQQFLGENPNYQKYNDMTGALYRCAVEVDRRIPDSETAVKYLIKILESYDFEIANYEDIKIKENGDV